MIAHYMAIAFANFRKSPFETLANVLTLALGLACFIAAYGIVDWWRSADAYHANASRTYVIGQGFRATESSHAVPLSASSTATLARYVKDDIPEIDRLARALGLAKTPAAAGDRKAFLDVAYVDPAFLEIFDFDFVAGDARTALADPGGVVLTRDAAAKLFGSEPAMGRSLLIGGDTPATVTGVIAPVRQPSFMGEDRASVLRFGMLRSWSSAAFAEQAEADSRWIASTVFTFATLSPNLSLAALNERLAAFVERRVPPDQLNGSELFFEAFPASELTVRELDRTLFASEEVNMSTVAVLLGLGLLTLVIACVNYANLGTAQALRRGKEIGLRKVLGAGRLQVMLQTWVEATLAAVCAAVIAIVALALAAPLVRTYTDIGILHFLAHGPGPVLALVLLVGAVGLATSLYPTLILSRVRPNEALRAGRAGTNSGLVVRLLVGVQFATASFLLIVVTVMQLQRAELERSAITKREDPIVFLNELNAAGVSYDTLRAALEGTPGVKSMSITDWLPWSAARDPIYFTRVPEPDVQTVIDAPMGYLRGIGYDYFETADVDLVAGRGFDKGRDTLPSYLYTDDPSRVQPVILDRAYVRRLGFGSPADAVGKLVYLPAFSNGQMTRPTVTLQIIGVAGVDGTRLEAWRAAGDIYVFAPGTAGKPQIPVLRLDRRDAATAIAAITDAWDELAPSVPVDVRYFDQLFEQSFRQFDRVGRLFLLLAASAFIIASTGLLGMAAHAASRRRHEIGVRKTMGSTTLGVVRLLLIDFSMPVLIANLLAWPLAYFAAETYLSSFANRVELTPAPFLLSLAITLVIACMAVLGEVLKAATVRPAEVLRHA